jgi:hypothetical protein
LEFRTFFEKTNFLKNGCGRHEMMTTPTQIHQFLIKLNEEAMLKVSSKKLHPFQNWHFSKNGQKLPRISKIQNS